MGKSCLMSRFCENKFSCNLPGTVSVGFAVHEMDIANEHIRVNCWDTPGQEPYRTITRSYYRGYPTEISIAAQKPPQTFSLNL